MSTLFEDTPPDCPRCAKRSATPVIYGDPSDEMKVASRLGEIHLGGIPEEGHMPGWLCPCGARY